MRAFVTEPEGGHKLVITRLGDMWIGQCSKETVGLMRRRFMGVVRFRAVLWRSLKRAAQALQFPSPPAAYRQERSGAPYCQRSYPRSKQ